MLKAKVNIQVLKVHRRLITSEVKRFRALKGAFSLEIYVASYGPQIDQSHGENRLSHIIKIVITPFSDFSIDQFAIHLYLST